MTTDGPVLTVDLAVIRDRYRQLASLLPDLEIAYAVKANPHPRVLACLRELGSSFDVASASELADVLAAGAAPEHIEYSHPIKPLAHLGRARQSGIRRYTVDGEEEIAKLAATCPGARVLIRMDVDHEGAAWPLADKFGVSGSEVGPLAARARDLGLDVAGLAFHVGSMQRAPIAYTNALVKSATVLAQVHERHRIRFNEVNVGGGLPGYLGATPPPPLAEYAAAIAAGAASLPPDVQLVAEPGRYLVADSGTLRATVIGTAVRAGLRWVYLDAGYYHGLGETDAVPTRFTHDRVTEQTEMAPTILAGPTCDSVDVLYRRAPVLLPVDLATGDRLLFHSVGAYCFNVSTQFNGFAAPDVQITDSGH